MNTLLIIAQQWPEPSTNAAGVRMMQLIELFCKAGYTVHMACAVPSSQYTVFLDHVQTHNIELNDSSFDQWVSELSPNIVLYDRFLMEEQFGWRVREACPDCVHMLDSEDLHFLRKARERAYKSNQKLEVFLKGDDAKREIASIYRSDITLVISQAEMDVLIDQFKIPSHLLFYLPFVYDLSNWSMESKSYNDRIGFSYVGNMKHAPNKDGVLYLVKEIWPLIKRYMPSAVLNVYGAYADQQVQELNRPNQGVFIHGHVVDIESVVESSRVLLSPLNFGAGLKGKLFTAMFTYTPVVLSSIAAEAVYGSLLVNGFIEDDPDRFAQKACSLYQDPNLWQALSSNSRQVLCQRYNVDDFIHAFKTMIHGLRDSIHVHREQNFIGSMLLHHSMRSTKYLSKWIELKNKNTGQ